MFGSFNERMDSRSRQRLVASVGVSGLIYAGLIAIVVALAGRDDKQIEVEREVEVTFVRKIEEPPPPPKPPPPIEAAPLAPGPVGPAAPAKPQPPKPPKPPVAAKAPPKAPTEVPKTKPPEAAEPLAPPSEPLPEGDPESPAPTGPTDPNGGDGPGGDGPPGSNGGGGGGDTPGGSVPVVLPKGATPPVRTNALITSDDYPRAARAADIEGEVVVKIVVKVDGTAELVKFIKSDPNFDDAVREIIKRLRYKPALYNGRPIAVFQNLRLPFEIE